MPTTVCRATHGLDTITGYTVIQTLMDGQPVQRVLAEIDGANQYGRALQVARAARVARTDRRGFVSYAVIVDRYSCGCHL